MADFTKADARTAALEGGYQAKASDSGNFYKGVLIGTNHGISAPTLATYLGRTPTVADMKALTAATAARIRHDFYWVPMRGDQITNQSIAELLNDFAINSGTGTATLHAQRVLVHLGRNLSVDGVMGPRTLAALNGLPQQAVFDAIKANRAAFFAQVAAGHPEKREWLDDWLTRLDGFLFHPPTPAFGAPVVG